MAQNAGDIAKRPAAPPEMTRRGFFQWALGFAVVATLGGVIVPIIGYLWPPARRAAGGAARVLVGGAKDLPVGQAKVLPVNDKPVIVVNTAQGGLKAFSAICTHLGCTVKYTALNQPKTVEINGRQTTVPFEFHCPCHGSKYYADGTNYAGPAPRPLSWYKLELSPDDGQVLVDLGTEVEQNFRLTV